MVVVTGVPGSIIIGPVESRWHGPGLLGWCRVCSGSPARSTRREQFACVCLCVCVCVRA